VYSFFGCCQLQSETGNDGAGFRNRIYVCSVWHGEPSGLTDILWEELTPGYTGPNGTCKLLPDRKFTCYRQFAKDRQFTGEL
jgi:hypothetical protein